MQRVAITGIGAISCLGNDLDTIAESLYHGRSGIVCDQERVELGFRSPLTGMVGGFEPVNNIGRKQQKTMTPFTQWSYAAALQALDMAGLVKSDLQNERTGLIFGCDSSCEASFNQALLMVKHKDTGFIGSGMIFQAMTSNITMNLNVLLKTRGACWSISSACSSSGHAVGQAAELIRLGKQDRVICGGAQEINWHSICSFDSLDALASVYDDPAKASRPFSRDRNGLVPSGGAAAILLESFECAHERGAKILGEVLGYGFSSDGSNISAPEADGMKRCMGMAITESGIPANAIDYVCAHATSTPVGDGVEAQAIDAIFGEHKPGISSLKGMTGHELWMAGAGQVVYTVIMSMKGFTAANINFTGPDRYSERLSIITSTLETSPRLALCNTAGFGGTNSSLVIRFDE